MSTDFVPVNCNQCERLIESEREIGMAYCMGAGAVYVCITCSPPAKAVDLLRTFDDFMDMAHKSDDFPDAPTTGKA